MKPRRFTERSVNVSPVQAGLVKSIQTDDPELDEMIQGDDPLNAEECSQMADTLERWTLLLRAKIGKTKLARPDLFPGTELWGN